MAARGKERVAVGEEKLTFARPGHPQDLLQRCRPGPASYTSTSPPRKDGTMDIHGIIPGTHQENQAPEELKVPKQRGTPPMGQCFTESPQWSWGNV